jgi:preprotein translocase subunit SecY
MTLELRRRVGFTIGALLVFRLGTYIPVPGIDSAALAQLFDVFAGGGVRRIAIFALGIIPLLTAAIIVQLLTIVIPPLKALKRHEAGRSRIDLCTRIFAIVLAAFQAYGIAVALEGVGGIVAGPGTLFRLSTVLTMTGGVVFLMWLSDQITARGIGNGIALIFALGIVLDLPSAIAGTLELGRQGLLSPNAILGLIVVLVALAMLIVVMELAQRRLPLEFPPRRIGARTIGGRSQLRFKLNSGGKIPATFASSPLALLVALPNFGANPDSLVLRAFAYGRPLYLISFVLFIVVFAFIYTALIFSPDAAAEDLKTYGGVIPGVEPGEATAAHLDQVLSRVTLLGAAYLALVYLVPELLILYAQVPFYLGGASLLIVVCAVLDLQTQVRGYVTIKSGG